MSRGWPCQVLNRSGLTMRLKIAFCRTMVSMARKTAARGDVGKSSLVVLAMMIHLRKDQIVLNAADREERLQLWRVLQTVKEQGLRYRAEFFTDGNEVFELAILFTPKACSSS